MEDAPINFLLITSDQQHWNTIGRNNPELRTPNLDRLAKEGTLFTRAYCPNPTCTPTRASMITGQYPSQHGAYSLGTKLSESAHTVGDDFAAAGYDTALIGKAHFQPLKGNEEFPSLEAYPTLQDLEFWRDYKGPFYGFRHFELARNHADEAHVGQHYALWMEGKGADNWRDYFRPPTGNAPAQRHRWNIPEDLHPNTWITERTNARLEHNKRAGTPFFLWASFLDPHPPYLVPRPWDTMYDPDALTVPEVCPGEHERNPPHFGMTQEENPDFSAWQEPQGNGMHGFHSHLLPKRELAKDIAIYYGMVSLLDKHVGAIIDKLDDLGLAENTVVLFTSDHGHLFGQHGMIAKGAFHYEDLIRVPYIVRSPGIVPEGQRSHALQSLVDLPAIFLSMAGLPVPRSMTGCDQSEVWRGERKSARRNVLVENRHQPTTLHLKTLVEDRYKITVYREREYGELFDLMKDPGEIENLWNEPSAAGLKSDLLLRLSSAGMASEPLPMPRIAGA